MLFFGTTTSDPGSEGTWLSRTGPARCRPHLRRIRRRSGRSSHSSGHGFRIWSVRFTACSSQ